MRVLGREHLNFLADADDLRQITRVIDGPLMNVLEQRASYLIKAKAILSGEAHKPLFFNGHVSAMGQVVAA